MKNKVKLFRNMQGLTMTDLAKSLGISTQSLLNIEGAKQLPNIKTALKLAKLLEVSVYELFILD